MTRRGFTFVELCLGIAFLAILGAALVGLMSAVGTGWGASESLLATDAKARQASVQIYRVLRSGRYIGIATGDDQGVTPAVGVTPAADTSAVGAGAAMMFWKGDRTGVNEMYVCDVALIEHDRSTSTLKLYEVPAQGTALTTRWYAADIEDSPDVATFKARPDVTCRILAHDVAEARFDAPRITMPKEHQAGEFHLVFRDGVRQRTEYGTATVRGTQIP